MKNIVIILLLAASVALGALLVHQQKRSAQTQVKLGQVQNQLAQAQHESAVFADAADQIASAKRTSKALQDSLTETSKFAEEKAKQAEVLQRTLAAKTNSNNPLAGMAKMFKDPKMKEMIKTQQKAVMGPLIDKQYAALFRQLNMTPEESASMKDLLVKKMLAGADIGMSLMDGSLDATKRAELTKQLKTETDSYDAQIKEFLGDSGYPAYQNYEKTVPDRMAVNQFTDQLGSGANQLSSAQQEQLAQALSEARTSFKWTTDYTSQKPADGDYATMFSEDKINQFTQEKERFDQQFLTQAEKILTPEQAVTFQEFQKTQRDMQIMGMKMAASMFAPKGQ